MDIVISKDDIVKHKDGGYRAGIRRRLSINPPTEGFGGKDTRFIHINLSSQEKMCGMRWQIDISAMKFSRYTASFLVIYIIS